MKHISEFPARTLIRVLTLALTLALLLGLGCTALALTDDDIIGIWESDDYYLWYEFRDDGRWCAYYDVNSLSGMICDGYYEVDGDTATLYYPDGSLSDTVYLDGSSLVIDDDYTLFPSSLPDFGTSELEDLDAVGTWECQDTEGWITIYPGHMYVMYDADQALATGYVRVDENDILYLLDDPSDATEDANLSLGILDPEMAMDGAMEIFGKSSLPFDHHSLLDTEPIGPANEQEPVSLGGTWEYDDFDAALEIDETAGTFRMYNDAGSELSGTLAGPDEDGSISLVTETQTKTFTLTDENTLTDWEGDTLTRAGR